MAHSEPPPLQGQNECSLLQQRTRLSREVMWPCAISPGSDSAHLPHPAAAAAGGTHSRSYCVPSDSGSQQGYCLQKSAALP